MDDDTLFENETRQRLQRLETELRCWRIGAMLVLPLAAVVLLGAMAAPPAKELQVHTLRVVDNTGTDRVVLTADPQKPDMTFLDPSGRACLTLDIADDKSPVFQIAGESRESGRLIFGFGAEGLPQLQLSAGASKRSLTLGVPSSGGPVIRVLDEKGKLLMRVP
jgi:hypothetical protein